MASKQSFPAAPARFMFIMAAGGQPAQLAEFPAVPALGQRYLYRAGRFEIDVSQGTGRKS